MLHQNFLPRDGATTKSMKKIGFIIQILITLLLLAAFIWTAAYFLKQEQLRQETYRKGGNTVYKETDELDLYALQASGSIDYSMITKSNTSMLFGGGNPRNVTQQGWDELEKVGIKAVRVPLFLEHLFPEETTLASFKNNEGNIQDSSNWNQKLIKQQTDILREAKKRGMTTLGVMDYSPAWLNINKQPHGVPADWATYEQIVTRLYAINRDYLDYIAIWNEPDFNFFLNTKNTPYTPVSAYTSIFLHAQYSIKQYDQTMADGKSVRIGGPALSKVENAEFLDKILQSEDLRKSLDFVSIHNYSNHQQLETSNIHAILKKHLMSDLPLFLTEWNYTSDESYYGPEMISDEGSTYVANQFIQMINQDITANFFFALQPLSFGQKGFGHGSLAFFESDTTAMKLLPKAQTWNLFSKLLALGDGPFSVASTLPPDRIKTIAAVNSNGENVAAFSNDTSEPHLVSLNVKLSGEGKDYTVTAFKVSKFGLPDTSSGEISLKSKERSIKFKLFLPSNTVVGIRIKPRTGLIL